MTPAELRKMLERRSTILNEWEAALRFGRSTVAYSDEVEAIDGKIVDLAPALLRLWEASDAVIAGTECTTMGGFISDGGKRRDTINTCKQKAELIDDFGEALDALREIQP